MKIEKRNQNSNKTSKTGCVSSDLDFALCVRFTNKTKKSVVLIFFRSVKIPGNIFLFPFGGKF